MKRFPYPLSFATYVFVASFSLLQLPCAEAQAITQLAAFPCDSAGVCPNGQTPDSLILGSDGNFYGLTFARGGSSRNNEGTVFEISRGGQLRVIYTFAPDKSGQYPNGGFPTSLVEGNDGFLYGTAYGGAFGVGEIFRLSKAGAIQLLHSFCSPSDCSDGANPGHLFLAADGNLYGDTLSGTLFRITPTGTFTVLYTLSISRKEGPSSLGMIQATDGNFYGTVIGGTTVFTTVFRLTPAGAFTILHTFHYPSFAGTAPVLGSDGKLHAAGSGGTFSINLNGSGFQVFPLADGSIQPFMQASDGNLWAGMFSSDTNPNGAILKISPRGVLLATVPFDGANGSGPDASLIQDASGTLLGVTNGGGSVSSGSVPSGVVFKLDAGLAAPKPWLVLLNPFAGKPGSQFVIYGDHLVGTKEVALNGMSVPFKVLTVHTILATVPAGATTGPVAVTNAGGTSTTRRSFQVE